MTLPAPSQNQQMARAILASWRRARPKAIADAISGSAAFELVEAIEGALAVAAKNSAAPHEQASEKAALEARALRDQKAALEREVADLRRRLGLIEGDLKPGAKAEDARPNCAVCGDAGFEVFNMEVIPCRKCVGGR